MHIHTGCAFPVLLQLQKNVEQAHLVEVLQKKLRSREQDLRMLQDLMAERDKLRRRSIASLPRPTLGDTSLANDIDSYFAAAASPPAASPPGAVRVGNDSAGDGFVISAAEIERAVGGASVPQSPIHAASSSGAGQRAPGLGTAWRCAAERALVVMGCLVSPPRLACSSLSTQAPILSVLSAACLRSTCSHLRLLPCFASA